MAGALVRAGRTDVSAVEHEAVVDVFPIFFRHELLEIVRYFFEVPIVRKVEAVREALHMGIGRYAIPYIVQLPEDHVRGLVADAVQFDKLTVKSRHLAAEFLFHILRGGANRLRFVAEERDRREPVLKFLRT